MQEYTGRVEILDLSVICHVSVIMIDRQLTVNGGVVVNMFRISDPRQILIRKRSSVNAVGN